MREDASDRLEEARRARNEGDSERALSIARDAVASAQRTGRGELVARGINMLAQCERDLRRPEAALSLYRQLEGLHRSDGNEAGLVHALRHIAEIEMERGDVESATPAIERSLAICRRLRTAPLELANTLRVAGMVSERRGDDEDAASRWREARTLYESAGVEAGVAECDARLGRRGG